MLRKILSVLFLVLPLQALAQNTYWVTSTSDNGTGSLRAAIQSMQNNGNEQIIRFQLSPDSTIFVFNDLPPLVGSSVQVDGRDTPGLIIDGINVYSIFRYAGSSLIVRGLTLQNGRSTGAGCLQSNSSFALNVFDARFIGCQTTGTAASGSGGGAIFSYGPTRITRSYFANNLATDGGIDNLSLGGGAISIGGGGSILIEDSEFIGNRTLRTRNVNGGCFDGVGGAVSLSVGSNGAILQRNRFEGNEHRCETLSGTISGQAGALFAYADGTITNGVPPVLSIQSNYFGDNRADNGAGIFARAVNLQITNSSFYQNVGRGAGAVFLSTGFGASPPIPELRLVNVTFWRNGNTLTTSGADLALIAAALVKDVRNTLFAPTQSGPNCNRMFLDSPAGGVNFTTSGTCLVSVNGNIETLEFASDNTFGLQSPMLLGGNVPVLNLASTSVAIDNGTSTSCPAADARGVSRPFDGNGDGFSICDLGAVEYRPESLFQNGFEN